MLRQLLLLSSFALITVICNAQSVGINNTTPDASAILDVKSTTKGMLIPRMTTAQRTAIVTPATGLMVFDITSNGLWFYNGASWNAFSSGSSTNYWSLNGSDIYNNTAGNVGIGTATPFAYGHGGNNRITEISNPNIGNNIQSHLILSTNGTSGSLGGITWASQNVPGAEKRLGFIGDVYETSNAARMVFYTRNEAGNLDEKLTVLGNGNVGIGQSAPDVSAILDIKSTSKGMLIPRMTTVQRNAIATPATGLMVFDISTNSFWFYSSAQWKEITTGSNGWSLTGNTGSDTAINFIGTTDAKDLLFRTNNTRRMKLTQNGSLYLIGKNENTIIGDSAGAFNTTGVQNQFIGNRAGYSNTTGVYNYFSGFHAGYSNTSGSLNTAVGNFAMLNNKTGFYNTAVGLSTLVNNTSADYNTAVGAFSLYNDTSGTYNSGFGYSSLSANTNGNYNSAFGSYSLTSNTTGNYNSGFGYYSLSANTTGYENTAMGVQALNANTTGYYNTATGTNSLLHNTSGIENTATGELALAFNNTGSYNTASGSNALRNNQTGNYNTAYGYQALYDNTATYNTAIGAYSLSYNNTGTYNTAVGFGSLYSNVNGSYNTAVGQGALYTNKGNNNTAVGYGALDYNQNSSYNVAIGDSVLYNQNGTGGGNTAVGTHSMYTNTDGFSNVAVGGASLYGNTIGNYNTALGFNSLRYNTTGNNNTAIGYNALQSPNTGGSNTAIGVQALFSNAIGIENTANGLQALYTNSSGNYNTANGNKALLANVAGSFNTAVGYGSLQFNQFGTNNTALGYNAGPNAANFSNTTCIGNGAIAAGDNQIWLGNANVTQLYCYGAFASTTATAANLTVLNTGQIVRSTSSRRYKKDIVPIDINTTSIYKLRPVSYNSFTDTDRHFGLIAEEVAEIIPELATYAKESDVIKGSTSDKMIPDAVQYPLLSVLLLKEVQKHEQTIIELNNSITDLKKMLVAQQAQIDALKK